MQNKCVDIINLAEFGKFSKQNALENYVQESTNKETSKYIYRLKHFNFYLYFSQHWMLMNFLLILQTSN